MSQIILGVFLAIVYLTMFFLFGVLLIKDEVIDGNIIIFSLIKGFFLYYSVFGIIALIMTVLFMPLRYLSMTWMICLCIVCIYAVWKKGVVLRACLQKLKSVFSSQKGLFSLALFIILLQIFFVISDGNEGLQMDNHYYIGTANTNIYTDTIGVYSPYSGLKLKWLFAKNLFVAWTTHSSVMGQIFGIKPLVEYNITLAIVTICLVNLLIFIFLKLVFKKNKYAILGLALSVWCIFWNWGYPSPSKYFFWSTGNVKMSIFPFVIVPVYFLFWMLMLKDENKKNGLNFLLVAMGGNAMGMTVTILSVVMLLVLGVSHVIIKRSISAVKYFCLAAVPSIVILLYYCATILGFFRIYIA